MTQEEKAIAYDEVSKEVKDFFEGKQKMYNDVTQTLEHLFPELKESEDEKIRKNIIATIHLYYGEPLDDEAKEMIAYLEKRGKNNIGISEATKKKLEDNLHKALEKETPESWNEFLDGQCEQKPADKVEPKFKVGQTIKKEGFNLGFTIAKIEDGFYYNDIGDYFPFTDQDNWKLVEQKPAWSEEDVKLIDKDVLVAEIEKRKKRNLLNEGAFEEDIDILSFIDTLERKKEGYEAEYKQGLVDSKSE